LDWIERIFHIEPDAGSGLLELAVVILVAAGIAVLAAGGLTRRARARARQRIDD
jgi:hypothetical protein